MPFHSHQSMREQEGHPRSIILLQWIGVLTACNKHHLEAVVFSKCVSVLVAQQVFFFPKLIFQQAGFPAPALQAHPRSACHWGQDGWQAAARLWSLAGVLTSCRAPCALWSGYSGEKDIDVYNVCVCVFVHGISVCVYIYREREIKLKKWQAYKSILQLSNRFLSWSSLASSVVIGCSLSLVAWGSITDFEICKQVCLLELWFHL